MQTFEHVRGGACLSVLSWNLGLFLSLHPTETHSFFLGLKSVGICAKIYTISSPGPPVTNYGFWNFSASVLCKPSPYNRLHLYILLVPFLWRTVTNTDTLRWQTQEIFIRSSEKLHFNSDVMSWGFLFLCLVSWRQFHEILLHFYFRT